MGLHFPPVIALWLTLGFIAFLFRWEIRAQPNVTGTLWIPSFWLFIIGSRYVSQWLDIFGLHVGAVDVEEGSPIDSAVFGLLIISGLYVLYQRRVSLTEVLRNNHWLTIYLLYCCLAILWSDFPFVALKRWLKVIGHPIMVLVILTEPDFEEAITQLLKRCTYVWVPVSVLFIKFFPQWGRGFSFWTGTPENCGIAGNKNMLGLILFISATFYFWHFSKVWHQEKSKARRNELLLMALFAYMIGWLMHMAQSSTSMVSASIAAGLMAFFGLRWINPRYTGTYLLTAVLIALVAEGVFGLYTSFLEFLGKSATLSDRTLIWHDLLQVKINPILGSGFESFWLGDHITQSFWSGWAFIPNEAHNCYLETYLNLGLIGLFLLVVWMIVIYWKSRRDIINGSRWGRFRLGVLVAIVFYNWTEANLRGLDPIYFLFFLIAMDYPKLELATAMQPTEIVPMGAEMTLTVAKTQNLLTNNQTPPVTI
jgi:O-antigen ligase